MGVSLSVLKMLKVDKSKFMKEEVSSPFQATFGDFNLVDEVGSARSLLKFMSYDDKNDIVTYNAVHYSDTIYRPVRVFFDEIEEAFLNINPLPTSETNVAYKGTKVLEKGYQEVYKFDAIFDFKTSEAFIFTKKTIANSFMSRFKRSSKFDFDFEHIYFDLSKIDELPELDNVWGVWEDGRGRCKRKAYFGTEVHKEAGIKKENITSYNVEYEYDNNIIDLIIAKECRVSSNSSILTNADLRKIYLYLKAGLKKT